MTSDSESLRMRASGYAIYAAVDAAEAIACVGDDWSLVGAYARRALRYGRHALRLWGQSMLRESGYV